MNASQFFFDKNKDLKVTVPSPHQYVPVDFTDIPDAPVADTAPILPTSGFDDSFLDFQPSQVFHTQSLKKWRPPYASKPTVGNTADNFKQTFSVVPLSQKPIINAQQDVIRVYKPSDIDDVVDITDTVPQSQAEADFIPYSKPHRVYATPHSVHATPHSVHATPHSVLNDDLLFGIPRSHPIQKDNIYTPVPKITPTSHGVKLVSIEEIPSNFRTIFQYPYFNVVQSRVFEDIFYTDKPVVVCAPTGSGKTVVFELAIVRLLMKLEKCVNRNYKIVYMAPIKALCNERYIDWKNKFEGCGVKLLELTGDTELDDYYELQEANIILTTPEKWDSMTRRWRDNKCAVQSVCLFFIDEIHVLNDNNRGATIEAVVSRMKTIQAAMNRSSTENFLPKLRFVAVSATLPNIDDIAEWLGDTVPASAVKLDESLRPVRLRKVVLGFPFDEHKGSDFQFDMSLNYKLAGIINTYSEDKPTLVFCSTRKSTQQAAELLARDARGSYVKSVQHKQSLNKTSNMLRDSKLRDLLIKGIGYHHAGMDMQDRRLIEDIFSNGHLQVLVATSTLAMGVNLPAHLVILKSTQHYNMGVHEEYSDTQVLQMIGRAGRPQNFVFATPPKLLKGFYSNFIEMFDTSATAVIMTKYQTKMKYESLLNGTQLIESSLHKHLIEHLNAEIVLHTINDISIAMEWIRYTFLYIRVLKNPKHYGVPVGLNKEQVERRLQDLCMKNLNQLAGINLITMDDETFDVKPTEAGRLMARYCIAYETMKKFCNLSDTESICDLLNVLSDSEEFCEISLRTNEKKTLNTLNKDKNRMTIRYPMQGKIKTKQMKVNCLIQAQLGCLLVQDFSLQQDMTRIFRAAQRIARCLVEMLWLKDNYKTLLNAVLLCKSFKARLWEDSKHVTKQLERIGPALSNALVNAGITSFQKIEETNPRELELIVNRHPPFGNQVRDIVSGLPKYELTIEQIAKYSNNVSEITISLNLANQDQLLEKKTASPYHTCVLMIGDEDNKVVYKRKIMDSLLMKENGFTKKLEIKRAAKGSDLYIDFISQDWVGLDVQSTYTPFYLGPKKISSHTNVSNDSDEALPSLRQPQTRWDNKENENTDLRPACNHRCLNKRTCGHDCCHLGLKKPVKPPLPRTPAHNRMMNNFMSSLKTKASLLPDNPYTKRLKINDNQNDYKTLDLQKFAYTPQNHLIHHADTSIDEFDEDLEYSTLAENNRMDHSNLRQKEGISQTTLQQNGMLRYNDALQKQQKDIKEFSSLAGTTPVLPQGSKEFTAPPTQDDWAELHMYQKQREDNYDVEDIEDDWDLPDPATDSVICNRNETRNTQTEFGNFSVGANLASCPSQSYLPLPVSNTFCNRQFDRSTFRPVSANTVCSDNLKQQQLPRRHQEYLRNNPSGIESFKGQSTVYRSPVTSNMAGHSTVTSNMANQPSMTNFGRRQVMCAEKAYDTRNLRPGYGQSGSNYETTGYGGPQVNMDSLDKSHSYHRYGQVVAWATTTSQSKSPDSSKSEESWSGSDNDLMSIDLQVQPESKSIATRGSTTCYEIGKSQPVSRKSNFGDNNDTLNKCASGSSKLQSQMLDKLKPKTSHQQQIKSTAQNREIAQTIKYLDSNQSGNHRLTQDLKPKPMLKSFFTKPQVKNAVETVNEQDRFNSIFDGIF